MNQKYVDLRGEPENAFQGIDLSSSTLKAVEIKVFYKSKGLDD